MTFSKKVLIAAGITALFVLVILLFGKAFHVLLLILGGLLIATYFRGVAYWLADRTKLSEGWALAVVIAGTVIIFTLLFWLLGSKIQSQASQLRQKLPSSVEAFKQKVAKYPLGSRLVSRIEKLQNDQQARQKIIEKVKTFFKSVFGILGDLYVMLFIAVFFTVQPRLYVKGLLRLFPPEKREGAEDVLKRIGYTLRSWLIGKICAMIIVAILTAIALYIIGVPFALVLAIIAGLLNFIPNFGPLIAMVPAVLVGFMQGTDTALIIAVVYIGIQVLESNFITPFIQKKLIEIPPALIIIAQVVMGVMTGVLGVILATPVVALIMVLVKALYVEPMEQKAGRVNN